MQKIENLLWRRCRNEGVKEELEQLEESRSLAIATSNRDIFWGQAYDFPDTLLSLDFEGKAKAARP